jgi:hypothetical protein
MFFEDEVSNHNKQISASNTLALVIFEKVGDSTQLGVQTSGCLPDRGGEICNDFP